MCYESHLEVDVLLSELLHAVVSGRPPIIEVKNLKIDAWTTLTLVVPLSATYLFVLVVVRLQQIPASFGVTGVELGEEIRAVQTASDDGALEVTTALEWILSST